VFVVFNIKYSFLLAFIIGVTNLIPYFGPFIGGAVVVLLMLLESPEKILYMIVFIIILQQLDSFIITPLVLGDKLKVNALWVVMGIILGGAIFGIWGIIFGAPLAAILVNTIERFVIWRQTEVKSLHKEGTGPAQSG